jgi:hypothetical protein
VYKPIPASPQMIIAEVRLWVGGPHYYGLDDHPPYPIQECT